MSKNHEETIRDAYVHSLVANGTKKKEAQKMANDAVSRNMFKRAEIDAYRMEKGHEGTVPVNELSEYVTGKYSQHCTVTGQGEIEVEEVPLVTTSSDEKESEQPQASAYTIADFMNEADACKNEHHLLNWAKKHSKRIKRHLTEAEVDEFRDYVDGLLAAFRGDPPVPEVPPNGVDVQDENPIDGEEEVVDDEPTTWQLAVEFDAVCTEDQVKQLAGVVSKVLSDSAFVSEGSCRMVTR